MSARMNMHAVLCSEDEGLCSTLDRLIDAVQREHAHELAEKIRRSDCPGDCGPGTLFAANLIDPEEGEVECSHEGLECQWSRCQEKKPPGVTA